MYKKFFLISLILVVTSTNAQHLFSHSKSYDLFRNYTKWGIQLDGLTYFPADIDKTDNFSFHSQYALGYKFGLVYNLNFSNNFGFRLGLLAGQAPAINSYFVLNKDEINSGDDYQFKKGASLSPIFNFSIPLLLEYRNFLIYRYTISLDAGIQIEYTKGATISESYKNYYNTTVINAGSWDFDFVAKAGWYFQFKPLMLQTAVVYKHRFVDQYTGTYSFQNLANTPDFSGKYNQRGDYIGLSFDIFFHKRGREVDMGCRANTQSRKVKKRQERARKEKEKIRKRQEKMKRKNARRRGRKSRKRWIFW